jgi:hypothetical protein
MCIFCLIFNICIAVIIGLIIFAVIWFGRNEKMPEEKKECDLFLTTSWGA